MSFVSLAGMNKTRCSYFPAKNISCKAIVPFIYQRSQGLAKGLENGVDYPLNQSNYLVKGHPNGTLSSKTLIEQLRTHFKKHLSDI